MTTEGRSRRAGAQPEKEAWHPIDLEAAAPLSIGLALTFALLIPLHALQFESVSRMLMVGIDSLMVVVFLAKRWTFHRGDLSRGEVRLLATGFVVLPFLSLLVLFSVDADPIYTGFVVAIVIACGAFLNLVRWLGISIVSITSVWMLLLFESASSVHWLQPAGLLLVATAIAILVFIARRRSLRSIGQALARTTQELRQREAAEQTLRASENRLELAIEGSSSGWWDVELDPAKPSEIPDGVYLSPSLKRLIGFEADEFPNSLAAWQNRIAPEDREKVARSARAHLAGDEPDYRVEYCIYHRSGEIRWMETLARVQRDDDGRAVRLSGVERDISELVKRNRSLKVLSRAMEQSSNVVLITDPNGDIEYVNSKFTEVSGYQAAEVCGRNPRILQSGKTPPEVYSDLWKTVSDGGTWQGELLNKTKAGKPYWVRALISPITDDENRIVNYLGIQEDVTKRKEVEERLRKSQRLEAVGQLVSGVAHDFNNLLTSILGFSELAVAELSPDSEGGRSYLEQVKSAAETAAKLTGQLLAVGRQQILLPRVLDLNDEIRKTEALLRRTLGEDIEIVASFDPEIGRVKVDAAQLQQVLLNLAVNGRDAMPDGGVLSFETKNVELDETYTSSHPGSEPGLFVMLAVSDNGLGMDAETLERIFEPFFTTKKIGRGSGLGLATVYGIVKQSGGFIWAYSEPGRGTTFKIYFPRQAAAFDPPAKEGPLAPAGGTETILLVEDSHHVRKLLTRFLSREGYTILEAGDSTDALRISAEHEGPIGLLITDVVLPTDNGLKLSEQLKRERDSLKVMLITGYAEGALRRKYALDPTVPLLTKPFTMVDLARMVREVLGSGSPDSKVGS